MKHQCQIYNAGFKETIRILGSKGIFQAFIVIYGCIIPNPIIKFDKHTWFYLIILFLIHLLEQLD